MSDDVLAALWDAIESRSTKDVEEIARQRRIQESRDHADYYQFGDPSRFLPGRIDKQRSRKGKSR